MSDIAFLLLIFFISTTIFRIEAGIPLVLPRPGASPVRISPDDVLVIHTSASGLVTLDGQPVTLREIEPRVRQRIGANPGLIVSVSTDPAAQYRSLVDVLDELGKARATRISLRMGESG